MHWARAFLCGDDGFSLVELMTVVLIIAVLLGMALASYVPATHAANAAACRDNQTVLETAFCVAQAQTGVAPDDIGDLAPYAVNFTQIISCPTDGAPLVLDATTGDLTCPNHP